MTGREPRGTRNRKHHDEELPWTVARCNRLLRSISSRINTIRRIVENFDKPAIKTLNSKDCLSQQTSPQPARNTFISYVESPKGQDPEWMPQANRHSARTYGGKSQARIAESGSEGTSGRASAAAIRTPFLRKLLRPDSNVFPLGSSMKSSENPVADRRSRKTRTLPLKATTILGEAHQNLISAFASFLNSTKAADPPVRKGSHSFRQICLKKVPQYTEMEQDWRRQEEGDEDTDPTDEVYTFLEELGHGDRTGYAGLRLVVRSHGLRLVTAAVEDGILTDGIVQELVEVCKTCEALSEGQSILGSWSQSMCSGRDLISSRRLRRFISSSQNLDPDNRIFLFRRLAQLAEDRKVTQGQLAAVDWIWRPVFHLLAESGPSLVAMELLEAYTFARIDEKSGQAQQDITGQQDVLTGAATLLAATIWTRSQQNPRSSRNGTLAWQLQRLLYRVITAAPEQHLLAVARPLLLTSLCVSSEEDQKESIKVDADTQQILELFVYSECAWTRRNDFAFMPDTAKMISHVDRSMAFAMMKAVVLELAKVVVEQPRGRHLQYLREMALEWAMDWTETQDDFESYDWAETVEDLFSTQSSALQAMQTPTSRKPTKYRWEAGMCEWIKATPFASTKVRNVSASEDPSDVDDSGVCMPKEEISSKKRSRSLSDAEDDSDLEDRDELSMQTPELDRLRDQRLRKARKTQVAIEEKENAPQEALKLPPRHLLEGRGTSWDDLSDDELGL